MPAAGFCPSIWEKTEGRELWGCRRTRLAKVKSLKEALPERRTFGLRSEGSMGPAGWGGEKGQHAGPRGAGHAGLELRSSWRCLGNLHLSRPLPPRLEARGSGPKAAVIADSRRIPTPLHRALRGLCSHDRCLLGLVQ